VRQSFGFTAGVWNYNSGSRRVTGQYRRLQDCMWACCLVPYIGCGRVCWPMYPRCKQQQHRVLHAAVCSTCCRGTALGFLAAQVARAGPLLPAAVVCCSSVWLALALYGTPHYGTTVRWWGCLAIVFDCGTEDQSGLRHCWALQAGHKTPGCAQAACCNLAQGGMWSAREHCHKIVERRERGAGVEGGRTPQ
jgi:hypothetical protein